VHWSPARVGNPVLLRFGRETLSTWSAGAHLRSLLALRGMGAVSVRPARSGLEHELFHVVLSDGQVRLGKVPRPDYRDPHWPDRRAHASLLAEEEAVGRVSLKSGRWLKVPEPYLFLEGDPPGALMGIVPGVAPEVPLFRHGLDPRTLRAICAEMGRMMAEVHRVRRPEGDTAIPDLPGADLGDARLLHMDFHLGNVLGHFQLGQGWKLEGIVDWTCVHWGPREADLAELGASIFATNPDLLDDFLLGYRQRSGLNLDRSRVLDVLVTELDRRMREDPPVDTTIRNAYTARLEEWSREI